jgi:hypothetical protein
MKATKTKGTEKKTSARKKKELKHDDVLFYEEESELEEALSYYEGDLSHYVMKTSSGRNGSDHEGYGPH